VRKLKRVLILLLLLMLPFATSQKEYDYEISTYSLYFDIIDENKVKEKIEIELVANVPLNRYVFYSDYPIESPDAIVEINGNTQAVNVTVNVIVGGINAIYVNFPEINPGDKAKIIISFYSEGMLQEVKNKKQFAYYVKFNQPVGVFYVRLFMPKGYAVLSPIIPSPNRLESSENRLILEWKKENVEEGDEFYFIVGFAQEIKRGFSPIWMIVIFLSAFIGGFFAGMLYKERKREKVEILKSDEEKIIEILRGGPVRQSDLVKRLGVSKAKVSLLLKEMERKGLIEKIKDGRSYLVKLRE